MKNLAIVLLGALSALSSACGYSSKSTTPPQSGVMPVITELAPDNTNAGGPAFILTVNGNSFSSTATVNWNGTPHTTTNVSANQLTVTIAASEIAAPATVPVTVTNPGTPGMGMYGGGGTLPETSSPMNFTVK
jgi:Flp pilus assembly protein TadG